MLICVTHRKLCQDDFLLRVQRLVQAKPYALMLREKDLDALSYEQLAREVREICEQNEVLLILHHHAAVAARMQHDHLQLSMPELQACRHEVQHMTIGASVHSTSEALEAQMLGAAYVVAGHVYATDCKKGLPPHGLPFLQQICQAVEIPVFAIGGINQSNLRDTLRCGVQGVCIMSEAMTCPDPAEFVRSINI